MPPVQAGGDGVIVKEIDDYPEFKGGFPLLALGEEEGKDAAAFLLPKDGGKFQFEKTGQPDWAERLTRRFLGSPKQRKGMQFWAFWQAMPEQGEFGRHAEFLYDSDQRLVATLDVNAAWAACDQGDGVGLTMGNGYISHLGEGEVGTVKIGPPRWLVVNLDAAQGDGGWRAAMTVLQKTRKGKFGADSAGQPFITPLGEGKGCQS